MALMLAPLGVSHCRSATPLLGSGDSKARATLAGTVSGPEHLGSFAARQIVAIELASGARHATKTNRVGSFSLLLPPGRYRLEVALASGEEIVRSPDPIRLEDGDLVTDADFVIAGAGVVGAPSDRPDSRRG
jgi:hypothetical protein